VPETSMCLSIASFPSRTASTMKMVVFSLFAVEESQYSADAPVLSSLPSPFSPVIGFVVTGDYLSFSRFL